MPQTVARLSFPDGPEHTETSLRSIMEGGYTLGMRTSVMGVALSEEGTGWHPGKILLRLEKPAHRTVATFILKYITVPAELTRFRLWLIVACVLVNSSMLAKREVRNGK